MKRIAYRIPLIALAPMLWLLDFDPEVSVTPTFVPPAQAIVGRPLTPVSVAGVARRTTRRAVVYSSEEAASASQQQAAQQQAAPPPQPTTAAPAQGTIVSALPAGCTSTTVDGVSLFNCNGVFYRPTFQSNNLVYVVQ
jgi:hypothetical protein